MYESIKKNNSLFTENRRFFLYKNNCNPHPRRDRLIDLFERLQKEEVSRKIEIFKANVYGK